MKDWTSIHSTSKLQEAEMIKGLLSFNGINSVVVNKQDTAYMFGEYEVYVSSNDVVQALYVIEKTKNG